MSKDVLESDAYKAFKQDNGDWIVYRKNDSGIARTKKDLNHENFIDVCDELWYYV